MKEIMFKLWFYVIWKKKKNTLAEGVVIFLDENTPIGHKLNQLEISSPISFQLLNLMHLSSFQSY